MSKNKKAMLLKQIEINLKISMEQFCNIAIKDNIVTKLNCLQKVVIIERPLYDENVHKEIHVESEYF